MKKSISTIVAIVMIVSLLSLVFVSCKNSNETAGQNQNEGESIQAKNTEDEGVTVVAEDNSISGESPFIGEPDETYYMVTFVSGIEYWVPVYEMFKEAGRQLGVKTKYVGTPEYDFQKELTIFEQCVARGATGILLAPQSSQFAEPVGRAVDQGIAVGSLCMDIPNSKINFYITSDNKVEGAYAAHQLAEAIGGEGEVAVLRNSDLPNHEDRIDYFIKTIEEEYPDIKVVGEANGDLDVEKSYQALLLIGQKNPNLKGIFVPDGTDALGAVQAAEELSGDIKVLCCDVNKQLLDLIKAGKLWGSINPNQGVQGYFGMLMLYVAAHPELIDPMNEDKDIGKNPVTLPFVDSSNRIVTIENADYYYLEKYLERRNSKGVEE